MHLQGPYPGTLARVYCILGKIAVLCDTDSPCNTIIGVYRFVLLPSENRAIYVFAVRARDIEFSTPTYEVYGRDKGCRDFLLGTRAVMI